MEPETNPTDDFAPPAPETPAPDAPVSDAAAPCECRMGTVAPETAGCEAAAAAPETATPSVSPEPDPAVSVVPAAARRRFSLFRLIFGGPYPPKYTVREVLSHVTKEYLLAPKGWFHLLFFVGLAVLFWFNAMHYWPETMDDAYITFRFSDHFIHGQGIVYNLGERVEGATSFLWMALIGGCLGLGWDAMFCSKALGYASCLMAMWGVAHFGARISRRRDMWNWMVVILLAANAHFACWAMLGLETQFHVAILIWAFARFYHEMDDPRAWTLSPVLATLAAMTRFESLYYMTPMAAYAAVQVARGRLDWRRFLRWGLICGLLFGTYFAWKFSYFGDPLPNTFYAKVQGDWRMRGVYHIVQWYFGHGLAFTNVCLIGIIACLLWPRPVTILILGPIFLNIYYVWHVNGDWMQNFRFFQVVLPFLALAFLVALRWAQELLPLWGSPGPRPARGRNGIAWIAVEAPVFGALVWLLFFHGRDIFRQALSAYPVAKDYLTPDQMWAAILGSVCSLLVCRWMSGFAQRRETARAQKSLREDLRKPIFRGDIRRRRLLGLATEGAFYAGFGAILVWVAPGAADVTKGLLSEFALANGVALAADARSAMIWALAVAWAIGLAARIAAAGHLARSLVRWPIYGLALLTLLLTAREQLKIATFFVWDSKPLRYDRPAEWPAWSYIDRKIGGGFSFALESVANWMLRNCQTDSMIFMSDIGYPMWLNDHMSLIDVDGLVDKHIADAPSVRGDLDNERQHYEEAVKQLRDRHQLRQEESRRLREAAAAIAQQEIEAKSEKPRSANDIYAALERTYRDERPLTADEERQARSQAYSKHRNDILERNRRYILEKRPDYCNIFLSHTTQSGESPVSFAYPDISRKVWESPEFKEQYEEFYKNPKYGNAWNHYFKRKDIPSGVSKAEIVRRLRNGVKRNPRVAYLYLDLAKAMVEANMPYDDEVRAIIRRGIRQFPGNLSFLNQLAQFARDHQDNETTVIAWNTSLAADPSQEWLYRQMADFYTQADQLDEALKIIARGIDETRGQGLCFHAAYLYEKAKRIDDAVAVLRKAAELGKDKTTRPYDDMAGLLLRAGRRAEALEAFRKVLEIDPRRENARRQVESLERELAPPTP